MYALCMFVVFFEGHTMFMMVMLFPTTTVDEFVCRWDVMA